ncbi:MAG TPA: chemotaxis protein CheW [Opitutales bacterium]|jgi:chemotaxis-related protein WspD|nr:chemotaxis protein CheW [Opitutales bacterium]
MPFAEKLSSEPLAEKNSCWRRIGVWGDKSCPELAEQVHCANCPVFAEAGRSFFDRDAPEDYLREWAGVLAQASAPHEETVSALVFRLGPQWLALPAAGVVSVSELRPVHRLPHRSGKIFSGLVNIAGELQLAFNLHALLELPVEAPLHLSLSAQIYPRLVLCRREQAAFAFLADEVYGAAALVLAQMQTGPSESNSLATFSRGQFAFKRRTLRLLDDELLAHALARNIATGFYS